MPLSPELQSVVDAAKAGQLAEARSMLKQILREDQTNEMAWFLYSQIADNRANAIVSLQKVLAINPYNERARKMLDQMQPKEEPKPDSTKPWDYNNYLEQQEKTQGASKKRTGINRNILFGIGGLVVIALILAGGFYLTRSLFSAPAPVSTLAISVKWTPTIDPCNCAEVKPYAERTVVRFNEMVDEMDAIGNALQNNTLRSDAVTTATAKAQARYDEQRRENPPPCLDQFDKKMVTVFWNWQQALDSLQKGNNDAVIAFMNNIIQQAGDIDTLLNQLEGQLRGCPIPRPTPPGRTG
jgi:tetratricopeptide (TPR) repeat protein